MGWSLNPLDDIDQAAQDVWHPVNKAFDWTSGRLEWTYNNLISRPVATAFLLGDEQAYKADTGRQSEWDFGGLFSGSQWSQAWDQAKNTSPGQAMTLGLNATVGNVLHNGHDAKSWEPDPFDPQARQNFFAHNTLANIASGALDLQMRRADPANLVYSKAAKGVTSFTRGRVSPTTIIDNVVNHPNTQRFLQSAPDMGIRQLLAHPIVRASANKADVAYLLSLARSPQQAETLFRIGIGDLKAYQDLMSDRAALAGAQNELADLSGRELEEPEPEATPAQPQAPESLSRKAKQIPGQQVLRYGRKPPVTGQSPVPGMAPRVGDLPDAQVSSAHIPGQGSLWDDLLKARVSGIVDPLNAQLRSVFLGVPAAAEAEFARITGQPTVQWAQRMVDEQSNIADHAERIYNQLKDRTKAGPVATAYAGVRSAAMLRSPADTAARMAARAAAASPLSNTVFDPRHVVTYLRNKPMDPLVRVYQTFHEPYAGKFVDFRDPASADNVRAALNTYPSLTQADRTELLTKYMAAGDRAARQRAFGDIEHEAVARTAAAHGVTPDQARALYRETALRRGTYLEKAKSRAYGVVRLGQSGQDGQDIIGNALPMTDGGQIAVDTDAKYLTQLAAGALPAFDGRTLDLALSRMNRAGVTKALASMGDTGTRVLTDFLDKVYGVWKGVTLLTSHRGFNHIGDDTARNLALLGTAHLFDPAKDVLRRALNHNQQMQTLVGDHQTKIAELQRYAQDIDSRYASYQEMVEDGVLQPGMTSITPDAVRAAHDAYDKAVFDFNSGLGKKWGRAFEGVSTVPGTSIKVPDLYGGPDGAYNRYMFSTDMRGKAMNDFASDEFNARKLMAEHDVVMPEHGVQVHANAILRYVRNHMAPDPVVKQLLRGRGDNEIRDWMLNTAAGRADKAQAHIGEPLDQIQRIKDDVNQYLPPEHDFARQAVAKGKYTMDVLDRQWPNALDRPYVAGDLGLLNAGKHPNQLGLRHHVQRLIEMTGTMPDDRLNRHPAAALLYRGNMHGNVQQAMAQGHGETFTADELAGLHKAAVSQTRKQMQNLLYDSSTFQSAGHTLRFIIPFYNAWQNATFAWTRLAVQDPSLILRGYQAKRALWGNPAAINMATGQPADQNTPMGNLAIVTHMPQALANKLGMGELNSIPINITKIISPTYVDSIGNPGWGPVVAIPLNAWAKDVPAVAENPITRYLLGGNISANSLRPAIPSLATDALNGLDLAGVAGNPDDVHARAKLAWSIWQEQMYDHANGDRLWQPNWSDVQKQASWLSFWTTWANRLMPLGFQVQGNHQFLAAQYKSLQAKAFAAAAQPGSGQSTMDAMNAAQQDFFNQHGAAGFAYTQSLSQNAAGIPATFGAVKAYQRYKDLVTQYPELASVIIGPQGDPSYNDMAYQWELANGLRTSLTPQQAAQQEQQNLGWLEYNNSVAANIRGQLQARGLTSINQSGAADLKAAKEAYIASTADPSSQHYNPAFYESYNSYNQGAYQMRIQALEKLATDPQMSGRMVGGGYMAPLISYFQARDEVLGQLQSRSSHSIGAGSNADLKTALEDYAQQLMNRNTTFTYLYDRFLRNDNLTTPKP